MCKGPQKSAGFWCGRTSEAGRARSHGLALFLLTRAEGLVPKFLRQGLTPHGQDGLLAWFTKARPDEPGDATSKSSPVSENDKPSPLDLRIEQLTSGLNKLEGVLYLRKQRQLGLEEALYILDWFYKYRVEVTCNNLDNDEIIQPILAEARAAIALRHERGTPPRARP